MSDNVLSGKRVWNDTLGTTALAKTNIPFISGGGQYAAFSYNVTGTPPLVTQKTLAYYPENSDLGIIAYSMSAGSDSGWNSKYKVFEFVSPVSVDDDLYNFVMNNSTPVIELSSPSGIVLETKGTYCDEDIMVMPSDSENIIAENIKNGVQILGVTGNYAPETSGGVKLNVIYSETEPTDTTKRWVKCTEPSKVTIDNNLIVTPNESELNVSYSVDNQTSTAKTNFIYNGIRFCLRTNENTAYKYSAYYKLGVKDKDSNEISFTISLGGGSNRGITNLRGYANYKNKAIALSKDYCWTSGEYVVIVYTFIKTSEGEIALNKTLAAPISSTSGFVSGHYILAVDDQYVYWYYGRTSEAVYKWDYANNAASYTNVCSRASWMIASRGICYNNKIYFFSSGGYCNILDVDAKTTQTNIQTGITEYLPRYIAQMGNKFYYQQIDGDHSNIKSLTADTWEIETVCQIPVTKKMDFGVYDEESETLMLSDDNGSYIFNINDFIVNEGELLLTTEDGSDYQLVNSNTLVYKAEPKIGLFGDGNNKGQRVKIYHYVESEAHWVLYGDPKLDTPTVSLTGNTFSWTAVENATKYIVYKDGVQLTETTSLTVDLSQFITDYGTYSITVEAGCDIGYLNSLESTAVNYTIEAPTITYNLTGCTGSDNNPTTLENKIYELNFTANTGYELPTSITATNCELVSWDAENGVAEIRNFTGDVVVTVTATLINYSVTYNLTGCAGESTNPVFVQAENSYSLVFTASDGYELPDSITVNGATLNSWDKSTGIAIINRVISNVTITIISDTIPASALVTDNDDGTVDIVIEELTANAENATFTENQDSTVDIAITNL